MFMMSIISHSEVSVINKKTGDVVSADHTSSRIVAKDDFISTCTVPLGLICNGRVAGVATILFVKTLD